MKATQSLALVLLGLALFLAPFTSDASTIWDHDPYAITDLGTTITVYPLKSKSQMRHRYKYRRTLRTRIRVPRLQDFVGIEDGQHTYQDTIQVQTYHDTVGSNGQLKLGFYYDKDVNGNPQLTEYANAGTYISYAEDTTLPATSYHIMFKNGIITDLTSQPGNTINPRKLFIVASKRNDLKQSHCVAAFTLIKDNPAELP